nr:Oxoglutarate/iron-dependent dioxygenase [Ipomoea batatas]
MSDLGSWPRTNRGRSRGGGGRYTPSPRGRSSRPSFQPNGSPPVAYSWRPRGSTTSGHNVEPCSSEGEGSGGTLADGISKKFASLSPLDNAYRHRGEFTPSGRNDEPCSSEREGSAETLANGIKKFASSSPVDNPYRHRGRFSHSGHNVERCSSERERSGDTLANGISKKFASLSPLDNPYRNHDSPQSTFSCVGNPMQVEHNSSIKQPFSSSASGFKQKDSPSSCQSVKVCSPVDRTFLKNESIHAVNSGFGKRLSEEINQSEQSSKEEANNGDKSKNLDVGFDICQERAGNLIKLKTPLHVKNKEKRNEIKRSMEVQNIKILCDGMVLLKSFISLLDQVRIVNTCRKLGIGPGGFYQPGYNDGAKLHLKMMCLGKNWDPETSQYGDKRPYDGAKPPVIPDELHHLVQKAIQHSQSYLEKHSKCRNMDDVLPSMSPNVCIVNFYTTSGKLGLHQDKDESPESIKRRLPVVSFSIGDAAEFLYSNERDPEKADKVILESGDVLIFGGKSRLIYHGVSSIKQNTASPSLLEETNLKPGRLNLTFRQY